MNTLTLQRLLDKTQVDITTEIGPNVYTKKSVNLNKHQTVLRLAINGNHYGFVITVRGTQFAQLDSALIYNIPLAPGNIGIDIDVMTNHVNLNISRFKTTQSQKTIQTFRNKVTAV